MNSDRHDLLRALHPTGYRDMRAIFTDKARERDTMAFSFSADSLDKVDEFANAYQAERNIYFGVAPRVNAKSRKTDGCLALYALFAELDYKDFKHSSDATRARLASFPLPPSAIIASGGGLHCYWLLDAPLDLQSGNGGYVKRLLRALGTAVDGDTDSAEVARILRLPGTLNHKYDPPRAVIVEELSPQRRYPLTHILEVLPPIVETDELQIPVAHDLSRAERMRLAELALRYQPAGFEQGYQPDNPDQHGDQATFKVCCIAANDFDLSFEDAYTVLRAWNARCRPPWPSLLLQDKLKGAIQYAKGARGARLDFVRIPKGKSQVIHKNEANILLALAKLHINARWDSFALKLFVSRDEQAPRLFDDSVEMPLRHEIAGRFDLELTHQRLGEAVRSQAWRQSYHPVKEYLAALPKWDGTKRLDDWLTTYGGAAPTPFVRAVSAIVLIAAVRRVRAPGCKFDELLVLESPQGTLKSTALRTLCPNPDWFSDDLPLGADAQELIERTAGKWLIEASELYGNARDSDRLKSMLSRQRDGPVRLAYDRNATEIDRQFILIGTTNGKQYLKDPTGARRFWPVAVKKFDVVMLLADRDQLWAEAAARETTGESIRLPEELWMAATAEQNSRHLDDPWEEIIRDEAIEVKAENDRDFIPTSDIWLSLGSDAHNRNNTHADRVAKIMQRLNYSRKRRLRLKPGEKQLSYWIKDGVVIQEDMKTTEDEPSEPSAEPSGR